MVAFSFENIKKKKKAPQFACRVYEVTKMFPEDEKFGLTSQFRRAAISIGANIAEGYRKLSKADKLRFLNISEGSLAECQNYIVLSKDLGYISYNDYECLCNMSIEVAKLIIAYSKGIINNNGIN